MKTRNVHGGTTHRVDRLTSRKAQAALALAVSLWIANGGVASADGILYIDADNNQEVTIFNSTLPQGYGDKISPAVGQPAGDKTLTVTGDWSHET